MKLYYSPGACSLSPHIVAREAGIDLEIQRVDIRKKLVDGEDYRAINPKGYVPLLVTDSGDKLTEGPAIVQYLADLKPESGLAPPNGEMARYHVQEWLNYISTELHKAFVPLFWQGPEDSQELARKLLRQRFSYVDSVLTEAYLFGDQFSVADAYLFTVINWLGMVKIDTSEWPNLEAYQQRVASRPAVRAAMLAEGLIKEG